MPRSSRQILIRVLLLLALAFIAYHLYQIIRHSEFSSAELLSAIRGANPAYLLFSLVAIYGCYALRALRWEVFQRNLGPSHFWNIYKMTLAGFSALQLLGRPGEPVRPILIARKEKLPVSGMFGVYALERIFDFASMAVIAIIALFRFHNLDASSETGQALQKGAKPTALLLALGLLGVIALLVYFRLHGVSFVERRFKGWLDAHGWRAKVAGILVEFARGVQTVRTWTDLSLAILYSALHWLLVIVIYFCVTKSFGGALGKLTFSDAMLVLALSLVGSLLQLPGVGGGSQAVTTFTFTKIFLIRTETALAVSMVIWLITFAACSLAGVPLLIREGFSLGKLKEMKEEEAAAKEV